MKVILQQDVKGQGKKGQMIEVSEGYGRNFLIPRKLAVAATADNMNVMRQAEEAQAAKSEDMLNIMLGDTDSSRTSPSTSPQRAAPAAVCSAP